MTGSYGLTRLDKTFRSCQNAGKFVERLTVLNVDVDKYTQSPKSCYGISVSSQPRGAKKERRVISQNTLKHIAKYQMPFDVLFFSFGWSNAPIDIPLAGILLFLLDKRKTKKT